MTTITKSIVFKWKIIGHETYKFTNCKKLYNTKTMREIKKSVNGYSVGFWINKKFVILKNLKPLLVKIEKEYCPFWDSQKKMIQKINKIPMSVNVAWQGKRYKSKQYIAYEKEMLFILPKIKIPSPPLEIYLHFGFSNKKSDIDNPVKPILDIMQKKYNFNDSDIYALNLKKSIVSKGNEFIEFEIKIKES